MREIRSCSFLNLHEVAVAKCTAVFHCAVQGALLLDVVTIHFSQIFFRSKNASMRYVARL